MKKRVRRALSLYRESGVYNIIPFEFYCREILGMADSDYWVAKFDKRYLWASFLFCWISGVGMGLLISSLFLRR